MLGIKEGLSLYNECISTEVVSLLLHKKPGSSSALTPPVHVWGLPLQHNSMECEYLRNKNTFLDLLAELWGIICAAPSWAGRGSFHSLCKNHGVGILHGLGYSTVLGCSLAPWGSRRQSWRYGRDAQRGDLRVPGLWQRQPQRRVWVVFLSDLTT